MGVLNGANFPFLGKRKTTEQLVEEQERLKLVAAE